MLSHPLLFDLSKGQPCNHLLINKMVLNINGSQNGNSKYKVLKNLFSLSLGEKSSFRVDMNVFVLKYAHFRPVQAPLKILIRQCAGSFFYIKDKIRHLDLTSFFFKIHFCSIQAEHLIVPLSLSVTQ